MPTTVKMHEAKTRLSSLVARALGGEEIVIARGDKPQVKLVPVASEGKRARVAGSWKGRFTIDGRFFEPLPEEELRS